MTWFTQPQPEIPKESKYTLKKVETLLETFGPLRLKVHDPEMKVMISQITWETIPHINSLCSGAPRVTDLAESMSTLDMLIKAVEGYVAIQDNPAAYGSQTDRTALMQRGKDALATQCGKLSQQSQNVGDLSAYQALTGYLSNN